MIRIKHQIEEHTKVFKLFLWMFLVLGCNLSIELHFWPDDIILYVFLVLCGFLIYHIELCELQRILKEKIVAVGVFFLLVLAVYGIGFHTVLSGGMGTLFKGMIKIAWVSLTAAALFGIIVNNLKHRTVKNSKISWYICLVAGIVYFYGIGMQIRISVYPIVLLGLVYCAKTRDEKEATGRKNTKSIVIQKVAAFIFACFEVMGKAAVNYFDYKEKMAFWLIALVCGLIIWTEVYYYVLEVIFQFIEKSAETPVKARLSNKAVVGIFAIMVMARMIFYLNWYPSVFSKDTYDQITQALGVIDYNNHQPWLHTMLIGLFLKVGDFLGGGNQLGIGIMALSFLVFTSLILLIMLVYFNKNFGTGLFWILAVVIYVIEPLHCIYSISIWKDTLFSYVLVAFGFYLVVMENKLQKKERLSIVVWLGFIVLSFLFCVLRSNGLYAWIFTIPFILYRYRKKWKPWALSLFVGFLLVIGFKGVLLPEMQVVSPDTVESLSVPLQQIAFTIQDEGEFDERDYEFLSHIADVEGLGEVYDSHISDPVKNYIREHGNQQWLAEHKVDFFKTYLSVGVRNPVRYMVAFLNQSRGYWYQKISNWLYCEAGPHEYAAEFGIVRDAVFPTEISSIINKAMQVYADLWHRIWSLALSTYILIIGLVYCILKRKPYFYYMPFLGIFLTLIIATPVNDEFRYAYGIYLALPMLLMSITGKQKDEHALNEQEGKCSNEEKNGRN